MIHFANSQLSVSAQFIGVVQSVHLPFSRAPQTRQQQYLYKKGKALNYMLCLIRQSLIGMQNDSITVNFG